MISSALCKSTKGCRLLFRVLTFNKMSNSRASSAAVSPSPCWFYTDAGAARFNAPLCFPGKQSGRWEGSSRVRVCVCVCSGGVFLGTQQALDVERGSSAAALGLGEEMELSVVLLFPFQASV